MTYVPIVGGDGTRMPSENKLAIARFQGKHVAEIAKKPRGAKQGRTEY